MKNTLSIPALRKDGGHATGRQYDAHVLRDLDWKAPTRPCQHPSCAAAAAVAAAAAAAATAAVAAATAAAALFVVSYSFVLYSYSFFVNQILPNVTTG